MKVESRGRGLTSHAKWEVLAKIGQIIASSLEIDEAYERFAAEAEKLIPFDRIAIVTVDRDRGLFTDSYVSGLEVPRQLTGNVRSLSGTVTEEIVRSGSSVLFKSEDRSEVALRFPGLLPAFDAGLRSFLGIPLKSKDEVIGALHLRSTKLNAYTNRHVRLAESVASQVAGAIASASLYSERQRVEIALRQSEARAMALLESAPQGIIATSMAGKILQVNDAALEIFGYSREELLGQPVEMLLPRELQPGHSAHRESYFSKPEVRSMGKGRDLHGLRKDGSTVPLEIWLSTVPTESGPIALAFISDISERKQAEEAERRWTEETSVMAEIGRVISSSLEINEVYILLGEEIRKLIPFDHLNMSLINYEGGTTASIWALGIDVPGRRTGDEVPLAGAFAGEVVRTRSPILLEASTEADVEHRFPLLMPVYNAGLRSFMAVPLFSHDAVIGVLQIRSKEQGIYTQRHLELLQRMGNQIAGAIANSQLYAQQKDAEERIRASLNEKEVLLKEVHHRVKNNLQVISSLLNLQARNIDDELARDILRESRNRVRAMALIHEQLYQSEDLARIPFGVYIQKLTSDLYRTYQVDSDHVTMNITAGNLLVGIDTAIPCGLIINELVSNSLKHAFPSGAPGEILIALQVDHERNFALTVSDNGVGIPDGLDFRNAESLGMQLVSLLVDQLGATVEIDGSRGTRFTITFMQPMGEKEFI